jgi:hypothetical protein
MPDFDKTSEGFKAGLSVLMASMGRNLGLNCKISKLH